MNVVLYKDNPEILSRVSEPVTKFDKNLVNLVNDMFMVTKTHKGVGLAAIQLGVPKRVLVINHSAQGVRLAIINPEIIWENPLQATGTEGCLSAPGEFVDIVRSVSVRIKYQNIQGKPVEIELSGFSARIFLHEFDHLQGIMCITKKVVK